jgi:hypothetical protein
MITQVWSHIPKLRSQIIIMKEIEKKDYNPNILIFLIKIKGHNWFFLKLDWHKM